MTYDQIIKGWELIAKSDRAPTAFFIDETIDLLKHLKRENERLDTTDEIEILKQAVEIYGSDAQEIQAIEELSELIQAITHKRRGREHNIAEEIADVTIMLEQLILINGCGDDVLRFMDEKLHRLRDRLDRVTDIGRYRFTIRDDGSMSFVYVGDNEDTVEKPRYKVRIKISKASEV